MADVQIELTAESQQRITNLLQYVNNSMDTKTGSKVHKVLVEAANEMATEAKMGSPVDTGRLRASIHAKTRSTDSFNYSNDKGESFDGGLKEKVREGTDAVVGTNVHYAFDQEAKHQFLLNAKQRIEPYLQKNLDKIAKDALNKK